MKIKIRNSVLSSVMGLVIFSLGWIASASAQADFYKGKTITVYAGTTPGALYDQWSRILAMHMGKHIPGKPDMIVQNMPGAGHKIAANYVYAKTKPDGLSLIGSIVPSLYFDQLIGRKEVQYDWSKFVWIGSPVQGESQMYMRANTPYKTINDVRNAKEPPRCGAQGTRVSLTTRGARKGSCATSFRRGKREIRSCLKPRRSGNLWTATRLPRPAGGSRRWFLHRARWVGRCSARRASHQTGLKFCALPSTRP